MKRIVFALAACFSAFVMASESAVKPVKYVFLFIGDGMSFPQRMVADEFSMRTEGKHLRINSFPFQTPTTTRSADSFITDSAASGTAIACGAKTKNHYVGIGADGERLESIAYVAKGAGRKVGIVTSVTLNHATPAAFYAHNKNRGDDYAIALEAIESGFDYFGGGGFSKHDEKGHPAYKGNIYKLAEEAGYKVSRKRETFGSVKPCDGKVISIGAGGALPYAIDRKQGELGLADFVAQAVSMLEDSPKGFFIMAEGGKIDWMCHANDAATVMREVLDLDAAVGVALDFQEKHPQDTLVVVTGDHETGGLTLGFANTGYSSYIERLALQTCSRDKLNDHLRATEQDCEGGKVKLEDLMPVLEKDLGLSFSGDSKNPMHVKSAEIENLRAALKRDFPDGTCVKIKDPNRPDKKDPIEPKNLITAALALFDNKCALGWTSGAHTALPVNTTALGVNAGLFTGMIDNTDVSKVLKQIVK